MIHYYYTLLGCDDGAVRLLGGGFENEGTIQVCYGNLWGLVSDNTWDENDARVVCRQLGYAGGSKLMNINPIITLSNNRYCCCSWIKIW